MAYTRYQDIPSKFSEQGNRVSQSTIYPPIARNNNDTYVLTTAGDTLYGLAQQYYGSVNYYWMIGEANDNIDKSTQILRPGVQLRIPFDTVTILKDFQDLNNI